MFKRAVLAILMTQLVVGCASMEVSNPKQDPYEPFNRQMFAFNEALDQAILRPVSVSYRAVVPKVGRTAVRNVFRNLGEPVNMVNALLQFDVPQALTSFWRFLLNSTLGLGGIIDFAGESSPLKYRHETFGQTLAVWSDDPDGTYLVLPIFGPSTIRDAFGRVVDVAMDPFTYTIHENVLYGLAVGEGVSDRESALDLTDEIYETSFDPYATIRSGYLQRNRAKILNTHHAND